MTPRYFRQIECVRYEIDVDLLICGCGCEDRSVYIANNFDLSKIRSKLVLSFDGPKEDKRWMENREFYEDHGFEIYEPDEDKLVDLEDKLMSYLNEFENTKDYLKIAIDYSSMTRTWYATILTFMTQCNLNFERIDCIYYYAENSSNWVNDFSGLKIRPIRGYSNITVPEKPTALVVGIDDEHELLNYLVGYFNADRVFCFHRMENMEESMLQKNLGITKWIPYSLDNMERTFTELWDLCKSIETDFRIVLLPCGPKPFTLISFLLRYINNEIDVWKVGPLHDVRMQDTSPTGNVVQMEVCYENRPYDK